MENLCQIVLSCSFLLVIIGTVSSFNFFAEYDNMNIIEQFGFSECSDMVECIIAFLCDTNTNWFLE